MRSFFMRSKTVGYVLAVTASVFVATAFVFGATTINNNISTDGTLSVSSTASIVGLGTFSGGVVIANSTSTITNLVMVNSTSTSATTTSFYVSGGFQANGASSTITNLMATNASTTNATTTRFAMVSGGTSMISVTPDSASTTSMVVRNGGAATNTIVDAYLNSFSFATSTVATPVVSLDTTGGGRVGFGTTSAPMGNLTVESKAATSTLYIASPSGRTCLQMIGTGNVPYRIYINTGASLITSTTTVLVVEPGSCL